MAFLEHKDAAVILISCLTILFSFQQQGGFYFHENWVQPLDTKLYKNRHFPSPIEKMYGLELVHPLAIRVHAVLLTQFPRPKPLVTDLDGDGLNEIVFVTPDYKIKIVDTIHARNTTNAFAEFPFKAEASLLPTVKLTTGRWPVALGSGYLTPYSSTEPRQQVIIVVTSGWTVLCFSSKLKLIWESNVGDHVQQDAYHREVAVTVVPKPIRTDDKGCVIVGGRVIPWKQLSGHNHKEKENEEEDLEVESTQETVETSAEHFSYYAFDGRTGALRWQHEEGDFLEQGKHSYENYKDYMPEHSYKLHVLSTTQHLGEVDWKQFKDSMLSQLPHTWRRREDTRLDVAHFEKRTKSGSGDQSASSKWSTEDIGLPTSHISGLPGGGLAPHVASDHISKPNVVVAHHTEGIEIVHLYTGRTLCRMKLMDGLYADINGDGIVDRVQAFSGHVPAPSHGRKPEQSLACLAVATTGLPVMEQLFNGSICTQSSGFFGQFFSQITMVDQETREGIETTNPIVVESKRSSTLLSDHPQHEWDTLFLISTGRMSSFRPNGKVNWQIDTPSAWTTKKNAAKDTKRKGIQTPLIPSLEAFDIEEFGEEKCILAVGQEVTLVSPLGQILTSFKPADVPIASPAIGDFNNDGINDLILVTATGYYGYTLTRTTGSVLLPILSFVLLSVIGFLYVYGHFQDTSIDPKRKKGTSGKRLTD